MMLKTIKTIEFWIVFLVFMCMGTVPSFLLPSNILDFFIIILCVLYYLKHRVVFISEVFLKYLFFALAFFLGSLVTGTPISQYFGLLLRTTISFFILHIFYKDLDKFRYIIYIVLWFFAIHGVLNFLACQFMAPYFHSFQTGSGYYSYTFGNLFFSLVQPSWRDITRNSGLFWEPGLFQMPLNILLYLILVVYKLPFKRCVIPLLVILSTISGTGLFIMAVIVGYRLFVIDKNRFLPQILIFAPIIIILSFITFFVLKDKLVGDNASTGGARLYDLVMGVDLIIKNPIFGIGYDMKAYEDMTYDLSLGSFYDDIYSFGTHTGNTNTIISIFMFLGIPVGLVYLIGLIRQKLFPYNRLFSFVIVVSLLSEPLTSITFIWLIVLSSSLKSRCSHLYYYK